MKSGVIPERIIHFPLRAEKSFTVSWNWIWIGLFTIMIGIFLICMPKYVDDYIYMYHQRDWFFNQEVMNPEMGGNIFKAGIPWDSFIQTWSEKYHTDNSRFGNIIVVFFLLLPKWVGSGLVTLGWIWIMLSGLRMIGINPSRSWLVAPAIFLWGFFMPWRNHFGSLDYQFNYLVPLGLIFLLLWILRRSIMKTHYSGVSCAGIFLLSFLCGGWQEGLALPVMLTLVCMWILYRRMRNRICAISIIGLALGLTWIFTAPGQWLRISSINFDTTDKYTPAFFGRLIMATFIYWCMIALVVFTWLRSRKRKNIFIWLRSYPILIFITISGFLSVGIVFLTYSDARVGSWSTTMGIFGILYILRRRYSAYWETKSVGRTVGSIVLLGAVYAHWVAVDVQVFRIRHSLMDNIEKYIANPHEPVFIDVVDRINMPMICGNMPDLGVFTFGSWGIIDFYKDRFGTRFAAVPKDLEYVTPEISSRIPGSAGMMEYKGRRFIAYDGNSEWPSLLCDYGDGLSRRRAWLAQFKSKGDGKNYLYVYLYEDWLESNMKVLRRVDCDR